MTYSNETTIGRLDSEEFDLQSVTSNYLAKAQDGNYDACTAVAIFNKWLEQRGNNISVQAFYLYLHAAYISAQHNRIFEYNRPYRESAVNPDRLFSQFVMYCYDKDFIETISNAITTPHHKLCEVTRKYPTKAIILTAADENYFRRYLLPSLATFTIPEEFELHISVVNPAEASILVLHDLKRGRPNVSFSQSTTSNYHQLSDVPHVSKKEQTLTLYACHRFFVAKQLLEVQNLPLLIVDADTDFLNSKFDSALDSLRSFDGSVGIPRWSNDVSPGTSYMADLLYFKPGCITLKFLDLLTKYIFFFLTKDMGFWTLDQVALNAIDNYMRRHVEGYRLVDLSQHEVKLARLIKHIGSHQFRQEVAMAT